MPIPGPGQSLPITTIATEFGGTVPHEISEYYRGGALVPNSPGTATIPTSGTIAFSNFYNTSATTRVAIPLVISASTDNYNVYTSRGPTYNPGNSDITVTINPGVTVGSSSTAAYAFSVPSCFSPADTITVVNNGLIQGKGGAGGRGTGSSSTSCAGAVGGNAIFVNRPTVITNNGTVAAGGGGGGGGGANFVPRPSKSGGPRYALGGGGGGGASAPPSAGGPLGPGPFPGTSATVGGPGTSPAGGTGGNGGTSIPSVAIGGAGGAGGGRGAAGTAGTNRTYAPNPALGLGGAGGAAGNYIVGNPFVTWPVTGTRQGGVA
jgi:hypothetical protein